ncbi:MAG: pilus assembly protein PilP [Nitrospirota bacterium]
MASGLLIRRSYGKNLARSGCPLTLAVVLGWGVVVWVGLFGCDHALSQDAAAAQHMGQINQMRPDSLKVTPMTDVPRQAPSSVAASPPIEPIGSPGEPALPAGTGGFSYDPSGRRDPFAPIVQQGQGVGPADENLPPLQRVGLTELTLIGIVWGAYGYTAMVQTPDGKGYAVRRGTRIGPNNGVVSAITERGIIVQERFTDIYGKKQEREYVKLLHAKEGPE